jgi:PBP4 family serine-type D-alanyl-D-alanine carboxypeptidase
MAEILKDVNKPSHNLRSEMLLRLLGVRREGEGSAAAGREAVHAFLAAQSVDAGGWDVLDGSGLSRSDLVTTRGMVDLLVAMDEHPHAAVFRDSLPVAGVDGTLKRRLLGAKTRGRIQAKTGTLRHTSALAGYATPARGDRLAFAIVVNHATATPSDIQEAVDTVAEAIVGS